MQTNGYADEVGVLLHLCRDRFTIGSDQSHFSLPEFEVWLAHRFAPVGCRAGVPGTCISKQPLPVVKIQSAKPQERNERQL